MILLPRRVGKIVAGTMALLIRVLFFKGGRPPVSETRSSFFRGNLSWLIFFGGSEKNLEMNPQGGETLRVKTQRGHIQIEERL